MSNAWIAGAKELEYIENGKRNLFYFSCCILRLEESKTLYYSRAKRIRRNGWCQTRGLVPVEYLRWSVFAKIING